MILEVFRSPGQPQGKKIVSPAKDIPALVQTLGRDFAKEALFLAED